MKSKQLTILQKSLFVSAILGLILIIGIFIYQENKLKQETDEKFKLQQEQSKIYQKQIAIKNKKMTEVTRKYEYLEKRKLTNKRSISAFLNEIHNLGFNDSGSERSSDGMYGMKGNTEYEYIKKDGEFYVSVIVKAYDDNTCSIIIDANY